MEIIFLSLFYESVFEKHFENKFDSRLEMQGAVYLAQELGAPIGNYYFHLYECGVHSQNLIDDMHWIDNIKRNTITFSAHTQSVIQRIKNMIQKKPNCYSTVQWL